MSRRMFSDDRLPLPRVFMCGPRWRGHFGVEERLLAEVHPWAMYHRPGKKILMFSLESDVRELVQEEIRPGVFAEWSDPYERWPR